VPFSWWRRIRRPAQLDCHAEFCRTAYIGAEIASNLSATDHMGSTNLEPGTPRYQRLVDHSDGAMIWSR
jgi:hypothetical protein